MILENLKYIKLSPCLTFSNGEYDVKVEDYHPQSCCEKHYLDWYYGMDDFNKDQTFTLDTDDIEKMFEKVGDYGIRINPNEGTGYTIPVPGYGSNNGYYNHEILLRVDIYKEGKLIEKLEYDYSECQEITWSN